VRMPWSKADPPSSSRKGEQCQANYITLYIRFMWWMEFSFLISCPLFSAPLVSRLFICHLQRNNEPSVQQMPVTETCCGIFDPSFDLGNFSFFLVFPYFFFLLFFILFKWNSDFIRHQMRELRSTFIVFFSFRPVEATY
jgi:hypothetical protein